MKPLYLLAFIPFIAILIGVPLANRLTPYVLGLPFSMFWIIMWVILTSIILAIMYKFDQHEEEESV